MQDAGDQAALQRWLPIEYQQLSAGPYHGEFRELILPGARVVAESQSQVVLKRGVMAPETCTVSFARTPESRENVRFSELRSGSSDVFFLPSGCEFDVQVPPGQESVYFAFERQEFLAAAMALEERYWSGRLEGLTACRTLRFPDLSALVDHVREASLRPEAGEVTSARNLQAMVLDRVLAAFSAANRAEDDEPRGPRIRPHAVRVVRRAREYIDAALDRFEVPTTADVCRSTRVSERTLQYCFRDVLELTPIRYVRITRLNRVRAELRNPLSETVTVGDTATRWGFWHLSKFASLYRRMFGELPSETLRASRQR